MNGVSRRLCAENRRKRLIAMSQGLAVLCGLDWAIREFHTCRNIAVTATARGKKYRLQLCAKITSRDIVRSDRSLHKRARISSAASKFATRKFHFSSIGNGKVGQEEEGGEFEISPKASFAFMPPGACSSFRTSRNRPKSAKKGPACQSSIGTDVGVRGCLAPVMPNKFSDSVSWQESDSSRFRVFRLHLKHSHNEFARCENEEG